MGTLGYRFTEEQKRRLSKAMLGKNRVGHKHTEETKLKMSATRKGKTPSYMNPWYSVQVNETQHAG